jgi:hypothetical protein
VERQADNLNSKCQWIIKKEVMAYFDLTSKLAVYFVIAL